MKTKEFKNGASVFMDDPAYNGMITIIARDAAGNILDKIRVDTKTQARDYFRAFCGVAINHGI